MVGGEGYDIYIVDDTADVIVELANEGHDIVQSSATYTLSANVEELLLTGTANIDATGNDLGNTLEGNSGNNILDGGAGNDTLNGGNGNDSLLGGSGNDVLNGSTGFNDTTTIWPNDFDRRATYNT